MRLRAGRFGHETQIRRAGLEKAQRESAAGNLKSAMRRARLEQAEQSDVLAELRGAELARLEMLRDALEPLLAQIPEGLDLFDTALTLGERPRLFIDMIGFFEMGRDRRVYRFIQDTRHGRVIMAETERLEKAVEAATDYVARRLVEREKALAADMTIEQAARAYAEAQKAIPPVTAANDVAPASVAPTPASLALEPPPRGRLATAFLFIVELVGTVALLVLVAAVGFLAWRYGAPWLSQALGS
jgi:hypothetical protein